MLELELVRQTVLLQEGVAGRAVEVVLMLGGLARLGFDQQGAFETDPVLVLGDELHEPAELVRLPPEVGIEQRVVALATAPEHVVLAAELVSQFQRRLHLRRRVREHLGVGVRRGPGGIAGVAEQVGRSPEQLDSRPFHLPRHVLADREQVPLRLGERGAFRGHVPVVGSRSRAP